MNKNLQTTLKIAGIYNLLWGIWVIALPNSLFEWTGLELPRYDMIWQSVGMVVGVYGLGYWWASRDYVRHWPIVMVGFLGKVFGPIGILHHVLILEDLSPWFMAVSFFNDAIWWIPFIMMLKEAYGVHKFKE